jgi:hypothetical protein
MGSGPVVIGDDGSPPPALRPKGGSGVRVGRQDEFLKELKKANGCHSLLDNAAVISGVSVNGVALAHTGVISKVVVSGDGATPTNITVTSSSGAVKVCTDTALKDESQAGWGRYKALDGSIAAVSINNSPIVLPAHPNGLKVDIGVA